MHICNNTTCNVILPYGLSEDIKITRGVRQGCPLSPLLFILFLDPLMLQLEKTKIGYKIDENSPIPGGAYADDMVLHTHTKRNLQKLLDYCVDYFQYVGLDISVDGRDKSVYTNNTRAPITEEEQLIVKTLKNKKIIKTALPYYTSQESYKYLVGGILHICIKNVSILHKLLKY